MRHVEILLAIIVSWAIRIGMTNAEIVDVIDLNRRNLTSESTLELDLMNWHLNQLGNNGFTVCFSYLNSGINYLNLILEKNDTDSLDLGFRFDCEPECNILVQLPNYIIRGIRAYVYSIFPFFMC